MKRGFQRAEDRRRVLRDRRRAGARQEAQARHRGRGRPPRRAARHRRAGSPRVSRPRWSWPTASRSSNSPTPPARAKTPERILFSSKFACPVSGFTIPEIEPRLFSFNNPFGACPACGGLGSHLTVDPALVVPDARLDACARAPIAPWAKSTLALLPADAGGARPALQVPARQAVERAAAEGARRRSCSARAARRSSSSYDDGMRAYEVRKPFEGVITNLERRYKETESEWSREEIERYMTATPCEACHGFRLKPEALAVKIDGKHIGEISLLSVKAAIAWARDAAAEARRQAQRDRAAHPEGDRRPADLPARRRARLSHPVARVGHAVGRREPAHPARLADRLRPDRRALCARRALDRPAPARQRAAARHAAAPARPRQHRDRRRARRGRDPRRRLCRRHRPRRRRARRRDHRQGHARPRSRPTRIR